MIKNYFKIALRNAVREWKYSTINLVGLGLGIASFLFIIQYTERESSIDTFHNSADRIYKVYSDLKWNSMEARFPQTPPAIGTSILENFEEVERLTRIRSYPETAIKIDDKLFLEGKILAVDSNFLNIFSFEVLEGNPELFFKDPLGVVLSKSISEAYFGSSSSIGKLIEIDGITKEVAGVIADSRLDSHIDYTILTSLSADETVRYFEWSWIWSNLDTYLLLEEGADPQAVQNKIPLLVEKNANYAIERITGSSLEEFFANGNRLNYYLEPLENLYYDSDNGLGPTGNRLYINTFRVIAFIILLLACINYMNMATSRSSKRAREVGIRKIVGSTRTDLILQFISEALLFSLAATLFAVFFGTLLNDSLAEPFGIRWDLSPFSSFKNILIIILVSIGVTFASGLYPAFYLSSFQPAKTIKGKDTGNQSSGLLRNSLVALQFIISFGIIIMSFTINSQLSYLKHRDPGYNQEQLLVLQNIDMLKNRQSFKNSVLDLGNISSASYSNIVPGIGGNFELFKKLDAMDEDYIMFLIDADEDFFTTFGIDIISGSPYDISDINQNERNVVINNRAAQVLGLENPLGAEIMALDRGDRLTISGVMEEVDFFLGRRAFTETVIRPYNDSTAIFELNLLTLRLANSNYQQIISQLEDLWNKERTGTGLKYQFFDQVFDKEYRSENRLSALMNTFTFIAIFIALLGLLALVSYNAEQAKKTIGIRKVFGASNSQIILLLSKNFLKVLLISFVVAVPLANYFITDWLSEFVYQVQLSVWSFAIPGLTILALALLTSWYQNYKAASANPIDVINRE